MDEDDAVLVCGCGNSELGVDMYDDGENQQLLQYSSVCEPWVTRCVSFTDHQLLEM